MELLWSSYIAGALALILLRGGTVAMRLVASMVGHFTKRPAEEIHQTVVTTYRVLLLVGIFGVYLWSEAAGVDGWLVTTP